MTSNRPGSSNLLEYSARQYRGLVRGRCVYGAQAVSALKANVWAACRHPRSESMDSGMAAIRAVCQPQPGLQQWPGRRSSPTLRWALPVSGWAWRIRQTNAPRCPDAELSCCRWNDPHRSGASDAAPVTAVAEPSFLHRRPAADARSPQTSDSTFDRSTPTARVSPGRNAPARTCRSPTPLQP